MLSKNGGEDLSAILSSFKLLSEDDSPMVRRSCAQAMAYFKARESTDWKKLTEILRTLAGDNYDSVRSATFESMLSILQEGPTRDQSELTMYVELVNRASRDTSWRVR